MAPRCDLTAIHSTHPSICWPQAMSLLAEPLTSQAAARMAGCRVRAGQAASTAAGADMAGTVSEERAEARTGRGRAAGATTATTQAPSGPLITTGTATHTAIHCWSH